MNSGLLSARQRVHFPLRHPLALRPLHINFVVLVVGSSGAQPPSEVARHVTGDRKHCQHQEGSANVGVIVDCFFSYLNVVVGHHLIMYHPPGCGILKYYHKNRFSPFAELWPKCFQCTNYFNFTAILQDSYFMTWHQDPGKWSCLVSRCKGSRLQSLQSNRETTVHAKCARGRRQKYLWKKN